MNKVIINADDYGKNENCTKAIAKCMCDGIITNTTLMVNMPYAAEAVELARRHGFMDRIGLHVNLTEGLPLTGKIRAFGDLCGPDGAFRGWPIRDIKKQFIPFGPKKRRAIQEEVTAQFERFLSFGFEPGHFDSHHYVHCNFNLIPIVFPIARRFGFKTARRPLTIARFRHGLSKIVYAIQFSRMRRLGFVQTKQFGSFVDVKRAIGDLKAGDSAEMMVHPMYLKNGQQDMDGEMYDSIYCPMKDVADFVKRTAQSEISLVSYREFSA